MCTPPYVWICPILASHTPTGCILLQSDDIHPHAQPSPPATQNPPSPSLAVHLTFMCSCTRWFDWRSPSSLRAKPKKNKLMCVPLGLGGTSTQRTSTERATNYTRKSCRLMWRRCQRSTRTGPLLYFYGSSITYNTGKRLATAKFRHYIAGTYWLPK